MRNTLYKMAIPKERVKEFRKDWKRIRELSDYSLEHPLTPEQYKEMMDLAKKLNIGSGKVPKVV